MHTPEYKLERKPGIVVTFLYNHNTDNHVYLAISQDPNLDRHCDGLRILKKYRKLVGISRDPSFSILLSVL